MRQLENTVYRAIVLARTRLICTPHDFPAISGVTAPVAMPGDSPVETPPDHAASDQMVGVAAPASHAAAPANRQPR